MIHIIANNKCHQRTACKMLHLQFRVCFVMVTLGGEAKTESLVLIVEVGRIVGIEEGD